MKKVCVLYLMGYLHEIVILLLGLTYFISCSKNNYQYKIQLESTCAIKFYCNVPLIQKTDTIYSDNSGLKNILNVFSNKNDSSKLRIIYNQFGYDINKIKNLNDLAIELSTYKINSIPNTKILKIDSIKINSLSYLRIKYNIKQLGIVDVYSIIKNKKNINFEFIFDERQNSILRDHEDEIIKSIIFNDCY